MAGEVRHGPTASSGEATRVMLGELRRCIVDPKLLMFALCTVSWYVLWGVSGTGRFFCVISEVILSAQIS